MKYETSTDNHADCMYKNEVKAAAIEWEKNLEKELSFWTNIVDNEYGNQEIWNDLMDENRELIKEAKQNIYYNPRDEIKVLDVGSGPITALGYAWKGKKINSFAVDPLASYFVDLFRKKDVLPPVLPIKCECENLSVKFEEDSFDFVWSTDALDRCFDPLKAFSELIKVLKPGSLAILKHKKNNRCAENDSGSTNWNFDIQDDEFILWRANLKIYVQDELSNICYIKSEEVSFDTNNKYIIVKMKKFHTSERNIPLRHKSSRVIIESKIKSGNKNLPDYKSLTNLANKYGSDKGTNQTVKHAYTHLYDLIFWNYKHKPINFLELGLAVGGPELGNTSERQVDSPSVSMWLDYFENANIFGFDISNFSHLKHDRFYFIRGDGENVEDLRNIKSFSEHFDIIIDDASHASLHQQLAIRELYKQVSPGGLYVIEDLHWQSPFYENYDIHVPKTALFFSELFENNTYIENEVISFEDASYIRSHTQTYSSFPGFKDGIQSTKVVVLRKF